VILSQFWSRYDLQNFRKLIFLGDDQGELSKGTVLNLVLNLVPQWAAGALLTRSTFTCTARSWRPKAGGRTPELPHKMPGQFAQAIATDSGEQQWESNSGRAIAEPACPQHDQIGARRLAALRTTAESCGRLRNGRAPAIIRIARTQDAARRGRGGGGGGRGPRGGARPDRGVGRRGTAACPAQAAVGRRPDRPTDRCGAGGIDEGGTVVSPHLAVFTVGLPMTDSK
jgi:hypothetical protein